MVLEILLLFWVAEGVWRYRLAGVLAVLLAEIVGEIREGSIEPDSSLSSIY